MKKAFNVKLINGTFKQSDAFEIVLSMIDKKIEFNELNSFSNVVKFNKKDDALQRRIEELKAIRQSFIDFMNTNKGEQFSLDSDISIKIL